MQTPETVKITRQQVGQIGSIIGGIALLVGLLALFWTGLSTLTILALALGVLGIGTWAAFAPQDFSGFISGRQTRYSAVAFFSTLILVAIVALAYLLVSQQGLTFDMTQTGSFSLSPETLQVLSRVNRPIQITGFYSASNVGLREVDDAFFSLYETATNGLIRRSYLDPNDVPALAERFGVIEDGQVFIAFVGDNDQVDFSRLARVPRSGTQERDMTEAILRLLVSGTVGVYFDTSHQTRDALDSGQTGLSGVHNGMQESGIFTQAVDITQVALAGADIPNTATALVIARPLTDYTEQEVGVIDRFLDSGGGLLIMADVLFTEDAFLRQNGVFNNYLWANYGIRALDAAIVDPAASRDTPLDIFSATVVADTVTNRLDPAETPALFRLARALQLSEGSPQPTVANGRFISSSSASFGETNLDELGRTNTYNFDDGLDLRGPLDIALWAFDQNTNARIVLIGDSDFASNGFVGQSLGNAILFTDSITWVTGINESITFAPVGIGIGLPVLALDTQTQQIITFTIVILIPMSVMTIGIAIWARRVRR